MKNSRENMENSREKVSYCIGLEAGKNIMGQFGDVDTALLEQGFADAIADKTPRLEREEITKILQALQKQVQEKQKVFVEEIARKNKVDGEAFLAKNKQKEGVVSLPSGLQYKILESGNGANPTMHDSVTVEYRGSLIDGTVFDSTYERGQSAEFPVNRVIPGWSEALKLMKPGDKWEIFIPSYLGYGESGYGPQIQPNATLIFQMELVKIH